MSLLADLATGLDQSRRAALRRYGELLAAADEELAEDDAVGAARAEAALEELKSLMRYLDKSEAEVKADAQLVRTARQHRDRAAALPANQQQRVAAANAALQAYDAETAALLKARRAEYFRLYNAVCDVQGRALDAHQSRVDLGRMKEFHPDLLAGVEEKRTAAKARG